MDNELINQRLFLKYLAKKGGPTDMVIFTFMVEKPELYKKALKAVFPDKYSQPSAEAEDYLKSFIVSNYTEFDLPEYELDNIEYGKIFLELFL